MFIVYNQTEKPFNVQLKFMTRLIPGIVELRNNERIQWQIESGKRANQRLWLKKVCVKLVLEVGLINVKKLKIKTKQKYVYLLIRTINFLYNQAIDNRITLED